MSPAVHVLEHRLLLYRRTWRGSVFNSFLYPVLFLGAMGIGLGGYVDQSNPALARTACRTSRSSPRGSSPRTAMQTASGEATFPILAAIVWVRQFPAMLATPIRSATS